MVIKLKGYTVKITHIVAANTPGNDLKKIYLT